MLSLNKFKKKGYFVEIGAGDGINNSNTFLLESNFGWNGILVEAAKCWHKKLKNNRKCNIDSTCIWSLSEQKLKFHEALEGELSTLKYFTNFDYHKAAR